jgi:hypothetical protein
MNMLPTTAQVFAFGRLFGDVTADRFFANIYEKTFAHVAGRSADHFSDVFSLDAAEYVLLQHESHLRDFVRFHNAGRDVVVPSDVGALDVARWAFSEFGRGTTIIMNTLEDYHLPLSYLVRDIEEFMACRVSAAAYLTPTAARSFPVHFDTHDVIIAQITGSKVYDLLFDPGIPNLPLRRQQSEVKTSLGDSISTVKLYPGDVLYIPRGMVHVAKTDREHSVHVTFSLHPQKVGDLAATAVELAMEANSLLRESLSRHIGSPELERILSLLGSALGAPLSLGAILSRQRQRFVAGLRSLPSGQLSGALVASTLALDDTVKKAQGMTCSMVITEEEILLSFPGLTVMRDGARSPTCLGFPKAIQPALDFIVQGDKSFIPADLPGNLSDEAKLLVTRSLVREGLLQPTGIRTTLVRPV